MWRVIETHGVILLKGHNGDECNCDSLCSKQTKMQLWFLVFKTNQNATVTPCVQTNQNATVTPCVQNKPKWIPLSCEQKNH
jgi:cell wall assembly regulator SMI1